MIFEFLIIKLVKKILSFCCGTLLSMILEELKTKKLYIFATSWQCITFNSISYLASSLCYFQCPLVCFFGLSGPSCKSRKQIMFMIIMMMMLMVTTAKTRQKEGCMRQRKNKRLCASICTI